MVLHLVLFEEEGKRGVEDREKTFVENRNVHPYCPVPFIS